jgi:hypothetical protein
MLYAGLFLNAGLLEYVGSFYPLAGRLWWLLLILLAYGAFLGWGVFYVPARYALVHGEDAEGLVAACLGRPFAYFFKYAMLPLWLASWFAFNSLIAAQIITATLIECESEYPSPVKLSVALILIGLTVPAAAASASKLARASVFTTKLSFVVIVGLVLLSRRGLPDTMQEFANQSISAALPFDTQILLWAAPALLLAGRFTRELQMRGPGLHWLTVGAVVLPLAFAAAAGVVTVAGLAGGAGSNNYFQAAAARPGPLSWVNLLWLGFTVLGAARFAAHAGVQLLPVRWRGFIAAEAVSALLIWISFLLWGPRWYEVKALQYCAIPFVPLAGVLCAAALASRGRRIDLTTMAKGFALFAWITGCVVTCLPRPSGCLLYGSETWIPPEYCRVAWVVPGWVVSFGLIWLCLQLERRWNRP